MKFMKAYLHSIHPKSLLLAGLAACVVIVVGVSLVAVKASSFFAASDPENGTLSGNASLVSDANASGGKAIKFNTPPPVTPPPTPPPGGTTRPFPFPASMKPTAANTGLLDASVLTVVTGDKTYNTSFNGQTIANKDFKGFVTVTGANITFTNCKFEGAATTANHGLLDTESSTGTITVEDSEFAPAYPSATIDGAWTQKTNMYRVNIHGSVDGMKGDSNTLVQDSYIHDMSWFASDPNQGGGETHNDGVQTFAGETNITLNHNNIDISMVNGGNAALQSSGTNTRVENNWLDGGGCTLNFAAQSLGGATLTPIYVTNNRFGRHQGFTGCVVLISNKTVMTQYTGNVWDDTGQTVPVYQQHD